MPLVSVTIPPFSCIPVCVHLPSLVFTANPISDLANQILAGIMVHCAKNNCIDLFHFLVGTCFETTNTTFVCSCQTGWEDLQCQTKINYCANITCLNNGVCQPLFRGYRCLCLGESYFGEHCETTANQLVFRQTVSRSFTFVAIIAITSVLLFIVVLDVLKYCFGIDPMKKTLQTKKYKKKAKKKKKKKPSVAIRFVYVNAPSTQTQ